MELNEKENIKEYLISLIYNFIIFSIDQIL